MYILYRIALQMFLIVFYFLQSLSAMPVIFILYKDSLKKKKKRKGSGQPERLGCWHSKKKLILHKHVVSHFVCMQPGLDLKYYVCSVPVHLLYKFCFILIFLSGRILPWS